MTKNDEQKFAILMGMLSVAFGRNGELSGERVSMYLEFLSDLDIEVIEKAVKHLIETRKYPSFPTIAEIREAALGSDEEAEDEALMSWGKATRLISSGRHSDDENINEAIIVAFGSWERFGMTDPDMEASDRKHFIACYKAVAKKRRKALALMGGKEPKKLKD